MRALRAWTAKLRLPHFSLRHTLLLIVTSLTLLIAFLSGRDLYENVARLDRARELRTAIALSDQLFDAIEKVALERDLTLAMLQAHDGLTIAELEPRLAESRRLADDSVKAVLDQLNGFALPEREQLQLTLRGRHSAIHTLRPGLDRAFAQSPRARDERLPDQWERATTIFMNDADRLWLRFIRPYSGFDATVAHHLRYRHALRTIADYSGRERSIIGGILSENADPTLKQTSELLRHQGVLALSWQTSRILAEQSGLYPLIAPSYRDAASHYATLHDMSRELFYVPGAHHGGVYPIGPDLWFELSSQASESLTALIEASRSAIRAHMDAMIAETERAIAAQILIALAALLLCALSFWMIVGRVIRPINGIIDALTRATRGELVDFTPASARSDEIGQLTEVLQAFHAKSEEIRRAAAELDKFASALETEVGVRRKAEEKTQAQLERLALLHQISRAIGERQELASIFDVALARIEDRLPAAFACVCMYDGASNVLTVARAGAKSAALAEANAMQEGDVIAIDENGLSKCVTGKLVYDPDLSQLRFPFPRRLTRAGLLSFVGAPLQVESQVFGVLVVARAEANSFDSGECEFLRQLSEHIALAAHQAQLNSALRHAYDELRQTQEAVVQQERLRALGQMASGIAHDINNALSPMALYTESLLNTEPGLTQAGRGKLEVIQRAIDDAARTIARMSEFYRRRDAQLALSPVEPNIVLQQVLDLTQARWRDMPQQRGCVIEVHKDFASDLPPLLGAGSELRDALTNLVFNATDAMPDGGHMTLRTRSEAAASASGRDIIHIEVADNGLGMDEETRKKCLEPFFTTKGERGTGLGLAMVYGVVQRHGGTLDIESAPGEGTLVRMSFTAAPQSSQSSAPLQQLAPSARLKLLIVDDDPIILRSMRDVLETDGHVVTAADGGAAGIAAFAAAHDAGRRFDAVITDLGMPRMDGGRVARNIKAVSPSTPVILLTGWGERLKADDDAPAHVDRVLSKPPKLAELRLALAEFCAPNKGVVSA